MPEGLLKDVEYNTNWRYPHSEDYRSEQYTPIREQAYRNSLERTEGEDPPDWWLGKDYTGSRWNCAWTTTRNYPEGSWASGNETFKKNHKELGYDRFYDGKNLLSGDIIQIAENGVNPGHMAMFSKHIGNNKILTNETHGYSQYDKGFERDLDDKKQFYYRYVGTPKLRKEWGELWTRRVPLKLKDTPNTADNVVNQLKFLIPEIELSLKKK